MSNIHHLTAADLSLLEPLWKEQGCSDKCSFAWRRQLVTLQSESEAGDYLVLFVLHFKHWIC